LNNRQVEIFAAVMKSGTTSRAAELLGITQPAVSRSIADLEDVIGFSLFARVRNRLLPTPEAKVFYGEVEASFRGLDSLRAAAARIRDRGTGELKVASLSVLGASLVPRAIKRFREKHPTVKITLHVLLSREVRDLIVSGQFDVGLAADEIDVSGVPHQLFLSPPAMCALPAGHKLCAKATIGPRDLEGEPMIGYVPEDRARQRMDRVFEAAGIVPRIVVETIYATTVCALVAEGIGIGLVNPYLNREYVDPRVVLKPFEPAVEIKSLLLLPPDRPKSVLVRDFIAALMAVR
jgi:DNA-binding transcriptional LysR family regulator